MRLVSFCRLFSCNSWDAARLLLCQHFYRAALPCCLNHLDLSTLFAVHTRSLLADCGRVASRHRHVPKRTASEESLRGTARAITLCVTRALAFYRRIIAFTIIILRGNSGSYCFFSPFGRGPWAQLGLLSAQIGQYI